MKRRKLQSVRGNDGMIRVRLDDATKMASHASQEVASPLSQLPGHGQTISALEGNVASLRERLAMMDARGSELRLQGERQSRELTAALPRTAIAETEARALREALEEARRPAWRRWLGWH